MFDGPVDAKWIENMNTVLDDNMMLCLANGERIKLKPTMRILFEVQDLSQASPATVSRCGMVYLTPSELGWQPYVDSWIQRVYPKGKDCVMSNEGVDFLRDLFDASIDITLEHIDKIRGEEILPTTEIQNVVSICNFLEYFIKKEYGFRNDDKFELEKKRIMAYFSFSFMWSFGGSFDAKTQEYKIDSIVQEFFPLVRYP